MTAARGSRFAEMVAVAMEILDRDGLDALTMRNVADRLGIREASLYKHCGGRDDLLAGVAAEGVARMAEGAAPRRGGRVRPGRRGPADGDRAPGLRPGSTRTCTG